jgi:hypothetical protein
MSGSPQSSRLTRYGLIVLVVVSAGLAAASVLYQFAEHEHVHPGVPSGWEASLGLITDSIGFVVTVLVAIELMWGYKVVSMPRPTYMRRHPALAIGIVAAATAHGLTGTWHSLVGQIEQVPIWLDFIGIVMVSLLAVQMVSGYRLRASPGRKTSRTTHVALVVVLSLVVSGHALLGVYHTITG